MISSGRKDVALNPGEETILQACRSALESSKALPPDSLATIIKVVTQWPYSDRLACLDLLRCVARYPMAAQLASPEHGNLLDLAIASSLPSDSTPNENAAMMGARTLVNLFGSADGRSLANSKADKGISLLERLVGVKGGEAIGQHNRNVLIAVTTAAVNYSVLANKEKLLIPEQRRRLAVVLGKVIQEQSDSEVLYRALVALGTILATSKNETKSLGVSAWIEAAASKSADARVQGVASECLKLTT